MNVFFFFLSQSKKVGRYALAIVRKFGKQETIHIVVKVLLDIYELCCVVGGVLSERTFEEIAPKNNFFVVGGGFSFFFSFGSIREYSFNN